MKNIRLNILLVVLCFIVGGCSNIDFEIDPAYEKAEITGVELYNTDMARADQSLEINSEAGDIKVTLRAGQDITRLKVAVVVSTGATVTPSLSVGLQDLSQPKAYTVISPNGTVKKDWTITVN